MMWSEHNLRQNDDSMAIVTLREYYRRVAESWTRNPTFACRCSWTTNGALNCWEEARRTTILIMRMIIPPRKLDFEGGELLLPSGKTSRDRMPSRSSGTAALRAGNAARGSLAVNSSTTLRKEGWVLNRASRPLLGPLKISRSRPPTRGFLWGALRRSERPSPSSRLLPTLAFVQCR